MPQYASKQCTAATAVEDPKLSTAIANFDKCPSAVVLEQQLSESKLAEYRVTRHLETMVELT